MRCHLTRSYTGRKPALSFGWRFEDQTIRLDKDVVKSRACEELNLYATRQSKGEGVAGYISGISGCNGGEQCEQGRGEEAGIKVRK